MKKSAKKNFRFFGILFGCLLSLPILTGCSSKTVIISFETNCDTVLADQEYKKGSSFKLPTNLSKFSYQLEGWYYDSDLTDKVEATNWVASSLDVKGDTTLYANWETGKYTISFDTQTEQVFNDIEVLFGETVSLPQPDPVVKGTVSYPFAYWYHVADNKKYTTTLELTYPEDISLVAYYDYGVLGYYSVDENNRYYLNSTTKCITTVNTCDMACGTFKADLILDGLTGVKAGFVVNADLGTVPAPWESNVEYWCIHVNPSTGGLQLASVTNNVYSAYKTVSISSNKTGFFSKWNNLKQGDFSNNVFAFEIRVTLEQIVVLIDGEEQLSTTLNVSKSSTNGNVAATFSGNGCGFRANTQDVYFANPRVEVTHYQVNLDPNGGKTNESFKRYAVGQVISVDDLPKPTNPGFEFDGWIDTKTNTKVTGSITFDKNYSLKATWKQIPGGAFIYYTTNCDETISYSFIKSGEGVKSSMIPSLTCLGLDFLGWQREDAQGRLVDVNKGDVLVDESYTGEALEILFIAKFNKSADVVTSDIDLSVHKGKVTSNDSYFGLTSLTGNSNTLATVGSIESGRFSTYMKMNSYGDNGLIIGATIASDFKEKANSSLMADGSSYYLWNIDNRSGEYKFVKVTSDSNKDSIGDIAGYDVLASGEISNYTFGGRYFLSIETYYSNTGRTFILAVDGENILTVTDDGTVAGSILEGTGVGARFIEGNAMLYGLRIADENALGNNITMNLDPNGGTVDNATYTRHYGWDFSTLPTATASENYSFVGWSTSKDDIDTLLVPSNTVTNDFEGKTLYAFYVDENHSAVIFDANLGTTTQKNVIVNRNGELGEDFAVAERISYVFGGWKDAEGKTYNSKSKISVPVLNLIAEWKAYSDECATFSACTKSGIIIKDYSDGIYDKYVITKSGLALADKEIVNGKITCYVDADGCGGSSGLFFRGTNVETATSTAAYAKEQSYFWHIGPTGSMMLYDFGTHYSEAGGSTALKNVLNYNNTTTDWDSNHGTFENKVHKLEVILTTTANDELIIRLYIDDYIVFESEAIESSMSHKGSQVGIRFVGSGTKSMSFYGLTVSNDISADTHTLTLDGNGGTVSGETRVSIIKGGSYVLPTASKDGETFLGWATSADAENAEFEAGETISVSSDMILYAVYTDKLVCSYSSSIPYTYGVPEGNITKPQNYTLTTEDLPILSKSGYIFDGWYKGDQKIEAGYALQHNDHFVAKWSKGYTGDVMALGSGMLKQSSDYATDDIYTQYTFAGSDVAKFDGTINKKISYYYTHTGTGVGRFGLVVGAKDVSSVSSLSNSLSELQGVYLAFNNINTASAIIYGANSAGTKYDSSLKSQTGLFEINKSYEITIEIDNSQIVISIDGIEFYKGTFDSRYGGSSIYLRSNSSNGNSIIYGVHSVE